MKIQKTIIPIIISAFLMAAGFTSCQSSSSKVENAEEKAQNAADNVGIANRELDQAIKDSIQQFRKESEERITIYDKTIADFKVKIAKDKKESKAKYEKKLTELEQKSADVRKKLKDYNEEGKDKWETFKAEFNHDMDELGKAFKDLTVKNVK